MSVVEMSTKTTTRYEYSVRKPAAYGDVQEAMAFAKRDKAAAGLHTDYDDSLMVDANDEEIIVYWEKETK